MSIFVLTWEIRPSEKFLPLVSEVKQVGESQYDSGVAEKTKQLHLQALQVTGPSQQP